MKHLWKTIIFAVFFLIILIIWFFAFGLSARQPGSFYNNGHNAVWLGHDWVGGTKSDSEIQDLVNNLNKYEIDTVFVHTGPLDENGRIAPETYAYAVNFLEKAKLFDEGIRYQAWVGQIRSKIDLSDEVVRHNIANQSMIFTQMVGFDGIHFDIEPVWDEDIDFIQTLKESREILTDKKVVSVALAEFIPQSLIWMLTNIHEFQNYNSEVNYKNVSKYADQIVVMAYDTGLKKEWLYRWLVKEQTIWLTDLLEEKEVFIGIPAYDDKKEGFNPEIENLENGLMGVIAGLNNLRSEEENFAGVAIYPYWEIDEEEWWIYANLWQE